MLVLWSAVVSGEWAGLSSIIIIIIIIIIRMTMFMVLSS